MTTPIESELERIRVIALGFPEDYMLTGAEVAVVFEAMDRQKRAIDQLEPFMYYFMDKDRLRRAKEAWNIPRLLVTLLAVIVSMAAFTIVSDMHALSTTFDPLAAGYSILIMILTFSVIHFPANAWITRKEHKLLLAGHYDE